MAVKIPEFISLLRDIRDNMYVSIKGWYDQISIWQGQVQSNTDLTQTNTNKVKDYSDNLKDISVLNPTINVPPRADGSAGDSSVSYDPANNEFNFSVPVGSDGKNMAITYAVDTIIERDALTDVNNGEICYVDETQLIYIYTDGVWGTGIALAPATTLIALSDTPLQYTGNRNKILSVNNAENGVDFKSPDNLGIVNRNILINSNLNGSAMQPLERSMFGTRRQEYGGFTGAVVGTPVMGDDNISFGGSDSISKDQSVDANTSFRIVVSASGIATSVILDTGKIQVGVDSSFHFYVTAGGVTTTIDDLDVQVGNEYHLVGTYNQLSIIDAVTKETYQAKSIVTVDNTKGTNIVVGSGFDGTIKSLNLYSYLELDGLTDVAPYVRMNQAGAENLIMPLDSTVITKQGLSIISTGIGGANPTFTTNYVDFAISKSDFLAGGMTTISALVRSNSATTCDVGIELIAMNGKENITESMGTIVVDGDFNKVLRSKEIPVLPDGWLIDEDTYFGIRAILPKLENYNIVITEFKLEFGDVGTKETQAVPSLPLADATEIKDGLLPKTGGTVTGQIKGIAPIDGSDLTTKDYVDSKESKLAGVGFDFYGSNAPIGALACEGQAVSRATYALLFKAIGTLHGEGDGSTTFNLPIQQVDGLGLFNRGVGSVNGGVGTYQEDAYKSHLHRIETVNNSTLGGLRSQGTAYSSSEGGGFNSESSGDETETRPRSLTVLKCIWTGK